MSILAFLIGVILGLLLCLPMLIGYAASFILEGVAFTKLAKKRPVKNLWLVWIPYVEYVGKKYLMAQMSDETEYRLFDGKMVSKNRLTPFWIYLAVYCANMLLSYIATPFSLIPIVGLIISVPLMIVCVPVLLVLCFIEYGYFRDMLNTYKPGCSSNVTTAILITIFNGFTFGLLRAIYLLCLSNAQTETPAAE